MSHICEFCHTEYKYRSGLSNHRKNPSKKCINIKNDNEQREHYESILNMYKNKVTLYSHDISNLNTIIKEKDERIKELEHLLYQKDIQIDSLNERVTNQMTNINNINNINNNNSNNFVNITINYDGTQDFASDRFDPKKYTLEYAQNGVPGLVDYVSRSLLINEEPEVHNYVCTNKENDDFKYLKGLSNNDLSLIHI